MSEDLSTMYTSLVDLNNFIALDTIEKYDSMVDQWTIVPIRLPFNVAKMGIAALNDSGRNIMI